MTSSIDVLIPSRQRASLLDRAVQSLYETATDPERVKYLVEVDADDPELEAYKSMNDIWLSVTWTRHGYAALQGYYNSLACNGDGDWLLVWNDDAMMLTEGWDDIIAAEDHTVPNVLNFTGELNLFPAVSRPFYDVLGHLSLQCHTDTWIQEVARAARIEKPLMGKIQIDHVRDRIDDETKRSTQALYGVTSPEFLSDEMKRLRTEDVLKLQGALRGYNFAAQRRSWEKVPVEGLGPHRYAGPADLQLPDDPFRALVEASEKKRYTGWRNHEGKWRSYLGLDSTTGKTILDFGCGLGIEALQFARKGNRVILADINQNSIELAERALHVMGCTPYATELLLGEPPFFTSSPIDIFYCNGVLHHIPYARELLERVRAVLPPDGEVRLMVYSDRGWEKYTGAPAPDPRADVRDDPNFLKFVSVFDAVGSYADWYSEEKILLRFGDLFTLDFFDYITDDDRYAVAILRPK